MSPQRILDADHRTSLIVLMFCALLVILSLAAVGVSLRNRSDQQAETNHSICVAVNNINRIITQSLERSKHNIPKLAYYRNHPRELREQVAEVNRSLRDFRPRTCD